MTMKKEYDFSKAQRARFYRSGAELNLSVFQVGMADRENGLIRLRIHAGSSRTVATTL
jgi:hypothetical protein